MCATTTNLKPALSPIATYLGRPARAAAQITMINVPSGGALLWAPCVFAYVLTAHLLFLLNKEYLAFTELRQDFLCFGESVACMALIACTIGRTAVARRTLAALMMISIASCVDRLHLANVSAGRSVAGCVQQRWCRRGRPPVRRPSPPQPLTATATCLCSTLCARAVCRRC
jgi:hypothetical protein